MPEAVDTSTQISPDLPSIRDTQRPREPHKLLTPTVEPSPLLGNVRSELADQAPNATTPSIATVQEKQASSRLQRTMANLREGLRALVPHDKKIAPEEINDRLIADAVIRLTHFTGDNPFDVRSVMAEIGYYGDPSNNPNYLQAESATRSRLLALRSQGALDTSVLEEPNLHDQRIVFRVTPEMKPILTGIANPPKTSQ